MNFDNLCDFAKINNTDVGLISVDTYIKRHDAYKFVMKFNNKIYENTLEIGNGLICSGVFIKIFAHYFEFINKQKKLGKNKTNLFLKVPLYKHNGKKTSIMITMKFKYHYEIINSKVYVLDSNKLVRLSYEKDTIFNNDRTITYREEYLQCYYKIVELNKKHNKVLSNTKIDLTLHEPWDNMPDGYIIMPCIIKSPLEFDENDYIDEWDQFIRF